MSIEICGFFKDKSGASRALSELTNAGLGPVASGGSFPIRARFNVDETAYRQRILRFGAFGAGAGALWGLYLLAQVPHRELMYSVILPLSVTYLCLGLGMLLAVELRRWPLVFRRKEVQSTRSILRTDKERESINVVVANSLKAQAVEETMRAFGAGEIHLNVRSEAAVN